MKKKIAAIFMITIFALTLFTTNIYATDVTTTAGNNGVFALDGSTTGQVLQTETQIQGQPQEQIQAQDQVQVQNQTTQTQVQVPEQEQQQQQTNTTAELKNDATVNLVDIKDKELETLQDYQDSYGDKTYGLVAYILNVIRLYSIPFGFVGIAISGIYRYIIGIRKLDVRDKGFGAMIGIITVMVICQVLPLVFAIVVKGWRG